MRLQRDYNVPTMITLLIFLHNKDTELITADKFMVVRFPNHVTAPYLFKNFLCRLGVE